MLMILLGVFLLRSISNYPLNFILIANIYGAPPSCQPHLRPRGYSNDRDQSLLSRCSQSQCSAGLLSGVLLVTVACGSHSSGTGDFSFQTPELSSQCDQNCAYCCTSPPVVASISPPPHPGAKACQF